MQPEPDDYPDSPAHPGSPLRSVGDRHDDAELGPDEQRAWRSFVEGTQALLTHLDRELVRDSDLGLGEYMVLEVLADHPMLRMTDLAGGALASRSTISRQVSRLVELGDVERVPDTNDARNRLVRITPAGREHLRRAAAGHAARVRRHLLGPLERSPGNLGDIETFFEDVRDGL
ncbi:MarR family winged helix-turn-helix transcriptional regulator [Williamsia deligens]|nr:MarR family winged helix-turn-helix transcriptional regulator [Williamsia deligens]